MPVTHVLGDIGITDITIVPEQKDPDGNFPTCPYPNPEIFERCAWVWSWPRSPALT